MLDSSFSVPGAGQGMVTFGDNVQLFGLADAAEKFLGMGIWYNGVVVSLDYLNGG